jgi:hypothetical protein
MGLARSHDFELKAQCLELRRQGLSVTEIARLAGVSRQTLYTWYEEVRAVEQAEAARKREAAAHKEAPKLRPLFPVGPFTPTSTCPHHGPIKKGSVLICMVCHQSGMDRHPALHLDRAAMPKPEPRPPAPQQPKKTRRERRAELRARRSA